MRLYNTRGKLQSKSVTKYLIKWDKKSRSKLQFNVKQFFRQYWENHIVYEEFPVYGSKLKVDFINATKKIAVEVNGPQHDSFNKFFHGNSRAKYLESIKRDVQKRQWLELNNFIIMEIYEKDLKDLSPEYLKNLYNISIV
tara:strand:+ start:144 stop:563 length:420 start_codon:yes stop_codon:yes gene_type:complete